MPRLATNTKPVADVEKAIKAHDKAVEKAVVAQEKADAAFDAQKRAERELKWYANHPDLPEDFDLDEFRRSLEQPFDDDVDPIEPDEGEIEAVAEGEAELDESDDTRQVPDDDEPEPAPAPRARRTGKTRPAPEPEIDDDDPFGDD